MDYTDLGLKILSALAAIATIVQVWLLLKAQNKPAPEQLPAAFKIENSENLTMRGNVAYGMRLADMTGVRGLDASENRAILAERAKPVKHIILALIFFAIFLGSLLSWLLIV